MRIMKRIYVFLAVALATLLVSCAKVDEPVPGPVPGPLERVPVTVSVSLDDTRATIGGMKWEIGDQIKVWVESALSNEGYAGDVLDIVNVETGEFSGEIAAPLANDTYYAAYNAAGFDKTGKQPLFEIAASQNTAAGGATKAMLKGSYTGAKNAISFAMKSATAKLVINISQNDAAYPVNKVEFSGMNDETIAAAGAKTISFESASGASEIEFIVPAMNFTKGYKVVYAKGADKMYQSYHTLSGVEFAAGARRTVNCAFVPYSLSCEIDAFNAPKTSYDYYLAGDIAEANNSKFETVGRLSGGESENPWEYDEDAQGIFTGKIERGKAKVVISGMSSSLIPSDLKIKEYGCYVQRVGGHGGKDVYAKDQSIALAKDFSWDVLYKIGEAATHMIEVDAGDIEIQPYFIVNDGSSDTEYKAPAVYTLHVTGLPHRSDHKDLWYVNPSSVSGKVERHNDDKGKPVDMFRASKTSSWQDFCVKSKLFNIPDDIKARVIMNGVTWAPHTLNAYFWFDATGSDYVLHNSVSKGTKDARGKEKLDNLSDCDAYVENDESGDNYSYSDLGTGGRYGVINPGQDIITLTQSASSVNIYLWIYRGSTSALFDYPGYWCHDIKVQYASSAN